MAGVDVYSNQLIELLTKRGYLKANNSWQKDLQKVKNAFPEALSLIPNEWSDDIEAHVTIPTMGYWRCKQMFDLLLRKKQDAGEAGKSWLGSYKDTLLSKWDVILRAYRKNHIFLAETALFLDTTSAYEIPGLKTEVGLSSSRVAHLRKRIGDATGQIERQTAELEEFCAERGVTGSAPTPESILRDASRITKRAIPDKLAEVHAKLRQPGVARGIELYRAFAHFMGFQAAESGEGEGGALLPTLHTFCTYDGPVASAAELPDLPSHLLGGSDAAVGDEGGGAGGGGAAVGEIDWGDLGGAGDDDAQQSGDEIEIDWDIGEEVAAAAAVAVEDGGGGGGGGGGDMLDVAAMGSGDAGDGDDMIDLGIEMDMESDDVDAMASFGIELGGGGEGGGGVAGEEPAITVEHSLVELANREALGNDLVELQCFLRQRLREMSADTGNAYFTLTRDASSLLQKQTAGSISELLDACNACITALDAEELQRLLVLRDSRSAVRRLVDAVQSKRNRLDQLQKKIVGLKSDVRDLEADLGKQQAELEKSIHTTKTVQALCEEALSELLRESGGVRIVGTVNTI